jgi:NADH-quinone oxidoreductase subunit M
VNGLFSLARLDWTIYLSFLGVFAIVLMPKTAVGAIRAIALTTAVLGFVVAMFGQLTYQLVDATAADALTRSFKQFEVAIPWIPSLGISYHLGVDGISLPLLVLNGIVAITGVLMSWNVQTRPKEFFAFFLTLIGAVYGVFMSLDLFVLFLFYELAIIPKYFVIAIWGSTKKEFAAMKLVLYSFLGSALVLIGIFAMVGSAPALTFDLLQLKAAGFSTDLQFWCFPLVFIGFAVLAGMFPFHTWAPTGHSAAPTAASMLLAGVVMKLGAYGCLRVAMLLLPEGLTAHGGFWQHTIAVLAVIGIVYGAAVALVQNDFKFVIGYSSVSHMGFVLLGLMSLNAIGLDGAVLQMFSHGIVASLLFAVVGRMVYERTHTRELDELSAMTLVRKLPLVTVFFVIGGLASMGLPGFSGFVAELQVMLGSFEQLPYFTIAAGFGIVLTVWYTLRTIHAAFFGDRRVLEAPKDGAHDADDLEPLTWPEVFGASFLVFWLALVGLYPSFLLDGIARSVEIMIPALRIGGGH